MSDSMPTDRELDRLKSAVNELTILNDLALAVGSSMAVENVLDIIVEKARRAINAEQGSIMLVTPGADTPLQTLIRQADQSQIMSGYKIGISISGWVLKYRQPLIIEDLSNDDRFTVSPAEASRINTVLCVPIMFRSELLGVLIMANKRSGTPFTKDDLRLLTILAAQSGQLIRNWQMQIEVLEKKKLEYELELARDIQKKLLPEKPPEVSGVEIASFFRPHESVSGDYYDFFRLGEERIALIAADVSGHGPSAALVMTLIKGIAHSVISEQITAGEVLNKINRIGSRIIPPDMFVTMVYCVIDLSDNSVILANAGHNPVLYYDHKHNRCRLEEATGCAVNLLPEVTYAETRLNLSDGDLLFLYTDGLTEAADEAHNLFGIGRLINLICDHPETPVKMLIEKIEDALLEHERHTQPADDVLMIAVRITH